MATVDRIPRSGLTNQEWKVFLDNRTMGEFGLARAGLAAVCRRSDRLLSAAHSRPPRTTAPAGRDPEFEACFRLARATVDWPERMRLYQCMESIILRDLPIIPLYHYSSVYLVHPSVQGWTMNRLDTRPWKQIRLEEN